MDPTRSDLTLPAAARRELEDQDDEVRVRGLLGALRGDYGGGLPEDDVSIVVLEGAPVTWKRTTKRAKTGVPITPRKMREATSSLVECLRGCGCSPVRLDANVAIVALCYLPDRRRSDGDNLVKLVKDAATRAGIWIDDSQATGTTVLVELDRERPRTVIGWCRTTSSLDRTTKPRPPKVPRLPARFAGRLKPNVMGRRG